MFTTNSVNQATIRCLPPMSFMKGLDDPLTMGELDIASDESTCSKALGNDGIPSGILKVSQAKLLLKYLHELLLQC